MRKIIIIITLLLLNLHFGTAKPMLQEAKKFYAKTEKLKSGAGSFKEAAKKLEEKTKIKILGKSIRLDALSQLSERMKKLDELGIGKLIEMHKNWPAIKKIIDEINMNLTILNRVLYLKKANEVKQKLNAILKFFRPMWEVMKKINQDEFDTELSKIR